MKNFILSIVGPILSRKHHTHLFLLFLFILFSKGMFANVQIVYAFNNDFSINLPGEPIEQAIIEVGDTVRWVWLQGGHTTTSVAGSSEVWDALLESEITEFDYIFNSAGVFWYYCQPHGDDNGDGTASGMSGTITVLDNGIGACCLPNGMCTDVSELDCLGQAGTFQGLGTSCASTSCATSFLSVAVKDQVIYEDTEELSNGLGAHLWIGNNNQNERRRTLLEFDLSAIPSNALVVNVELELYCNSAAGIAIPVNCYKVVTQWGEGTSNANGNEGSGANATIDDATWSYAHYDSDLWTSAGGDYFPVTSGSTLVDASSVWYSWSSAGLVADVQFWIDNPASNHGWLVLGDEFSSDNDKRFASKDNADPVIHPRLNIEYVVSPTGACCISDGTCQDLTESACFAAGGNYQGDGSSCVQEYCPVALTPFLDALPLPGIATPASGSAGSTAYYEIAMTEQLQQLHSELPHPTRVWGYNGSYPGPTIEAFRNDTVTVVWTNDLREVETGNLRTTHALEIDTCLHGPNITGQTPVSIVHLHGGKVAPESDGYPDLAFPPGQSSPVYTYPNDQPASTIWYHDHGLGITRLNVMMGLAGFYIIRDSIEQNLNLPSGEFEVPLVIQDRSFNADGSLHYPEVWTEHFFGDKILVNGKVWPYLNVKQGKYRFRLLNGSNSRTYRLSFSNGMNFIHIATDLGLAETSSILSEIVITPGERAEIIVDFEGMSPGTEIILTNDAPAPYPGFVGIGVIPDVMKFIVGGDPGFVADVPVSLAEVPLIPESEAIVERTFDLVKIPSDCEEHEDGMWTINGLLWHDITEFPVLGTTEIWTWINHSGMTHPMHMHLVMFQILDRTPIDPNGNPIGPAEEPEVYERGWKDTVNSLPGYKTRVIARFEGYSGLYPYHCHILEHEDHEMMRQFQVIDNTVTGCTDSGACNYSSEANTDDGSCYYNCLACDADFSGDSTVNASDLLIFLSNFGCMPPTVCEVGDLNGDLAVNVQDLLAFLAAFGEICDQ